MHQRTKEGIETARLNGKQIGQPAGAKLTTKKSVISKEQIVKYSKDFEGSLDDSECMKLIGIARGIRGNCEKRRDCDCFIKEK